MDEDAERFGIPVRGITSMHDASHFKRVSYDSLNARQKENFNFQKVSARLADYGFNCLRLSDDWQGADFIACHIDGEQFLKVQLKARLTLDKKYLGKNISIAFLFEERCFVYPHDDFLNVLLSRGMLGENCRRWSEKGNRSWSKSPPKWALRYLAAYEI